MVTGLFRLEELGTSKATIRRRFLASYDRPVDDKWASRVRSLLDSRRTEFTLNELEDLITVLDTSHHQCVIENPEEFHRLVVASHARLEQRLERWRDLISQRQLANAGEVGAC
jgi:hypothetical protein